MRRVESVSAADVQRKTIDWLAAGRIPLGYLTLLIGVQGLGKSQFLAYLAAAHSRGELTGDPGVTLIASAEDAWDSTVRPRLEAWNADLRLVRFLAVFHDDGGEDGLLLPVDVSELAREVRDYGASLVTVDPVLAHLGSDIDSHKDASTRQALAPLARMADESGCAVVAAHHLNKSTSSDPLTRASASTAFTAQARSVLLWAADPDDPEADRGSQRALAHVKCNVAALAPTETWVVEQILLPATEREPEVETSRVRLTGETKHTGRELLAANGSGEEHVASALDEAKNFLQQELYAGRKLQVEVAKDARGYGISEKTLQRATRDLGVEKGKDGFGGPWYWSLALTEDGQAGWPSMVANPDGHLPATPYEQTDLAVSVDPENTKGGHSHTVATFGAEAACQTCGGHEFFEHNRRCKNCSAKAVA